MSDADFDLMTFQVPTACSVQVLDITPVPREVRVVDQKARLAWRFKPRERVQ